MSFLKTLFGGGGAPDPTKDWPAPNPSLPTPVLDLYNRRFGNLEFDVSGVESASFLGRPKGFKWESGKDCVDLYYRDMGYGVGFELNKFVDLILAISPAGAGTNWTGYASPEIQAGEEGVLLLDRSTTREEIEGAFGKPDKLDEDDEEEAVLTYRRNHIQLEFEIALPSGQLTALNVFSTLDEVTG
jgi:hypothetical protein